MIVDVSWNGKKVLIVGAGKQGKKKEALLKAEGADVTVVDQGFDWRSLRAYDLVVACTNDARVNHEIVVQAQKEGVFCASATYEPDASVHWMRQIERDCLRLGFSTRRAYPLYGKTMARDIEALYDEKWKRRLKALRRLRPFLRKDPALLAAVMEWRVDQLEWLGNAVQAKAGKVCVFHSCQSEAQHAWIRARLGEGVMPFYMRENWESACAVFSLLELPVEVQPMFVFAGRIYRQFEALCERHRPLLLDENGWRRVLAPFDRPEAVFVVHRSQHDALKKRVAACCHEAVVVDYEEELPVNKERMVVYPLFMLDGGHVENDVANQIARARERGADVRWGCRCLLDLSSFQELLRDRL